MRYIASHWGNKVYIGDSIDQILEISKKDVLSAAVERAEYDRKLPAYGICKVTQQPYIYKVIYKKNKIIIGAMSTIHCSYPDHELEWNPTTTFTLTKC